MILEGSIGEIAEQLEPSDIQVEQRLDVVAASEVMS